jgi:hypothetical protein
MPASENAKYMLLTSVRRSLHNAAAQDNPGHKNMCCNAANCPQGNFRSREHPIAEQRRPAPLPSDTRDIKQGVGATMRDTRRTMSNSQY